jgi:hypothetical protein
MYEADYSLYLSMSNGAKIEAPAVPPAQIVRFVIGIILFGVLMGVKEEFHSIWIRMLLAGCAGGVLGVFVIPLRKYKR